MANFTTQHTRTNRGATVRMPAQLQERESQQDRRPPLRIYAFSALIIEGCEQARHYVGYKAAINIDQAYRDALAECYRHFPLSHGYDGHSVEIVEIHGVQLQEVRR
jgi:hypothetical protein